MNSIVKRSRYLSMNRIISDVWGRVPTRKKLTQPSAVRWYPVALGFHVAAWRFRLAYPLACVRQHVLHVERLASIVLLCAETPSFGATILHACCIERFSAKMRSSTRRTTRSLASWSNFLGMVQIFPSTQTEQNLGHFRHLWVRPITSAQTSGKPYMSNVFSAAPLTTLIPR